MSVSGLTLKMGTLAPAGSPWDNALHRLAAEWTQFSGGRINVTIYPGAIAGGEGDMVRKMRIGQLQAAALTGSGLENIVRDVFLLDLPFLFSSQTEATYVLSKVTPHYKRLFAEKGFVLLGWTVAGWVNFFSRNPVVLPSDLQAETLAVSGVNPDQVQAWKSVGFHVIPLDTPNLMSALSSGMIDALYTSPLAAASYQWFGIANNMCALNIAPLIGAIVVSERSWRRIAEPYRADMVSSAQQAIRPLYSSTRKLEKQAVQVMEANGLTVNQVPPAAAEKWRSLLEGGIRPLIGKSYSVDVYDEIKGYIAEFRSSHGD
jgi:TRAP-type C4-dicarboxylate transport system substrate-binding protein